MSRPGDDHDGPGSQLPRQLLRAEREVRHSNSSCATSAGMSGVSCTAGSSGRHPGHRGVSRTAVYGAVSASTAASPKPGRSIAIARYAAPAMATRRSLPIRGRPRPRAAAPQPGPARARREAAPIGIISHSASGALAAERQRAHARVGRWPALPCTGRMNEAALPCPAVLLSARVDRYYGRLRHPPGSRSTSRLNTGYRPRHSDTTNRRRPAGRGGPPQFPPPPSKTFRALYTGEFLGAANPGSSPLTWPSP